MKYMYLTVTPRCYSSISADQMIRGYEEQVDFITRSKKSIQAQNEKVLKYF